MMKLYKGIEDVHEAEANLARQLYRLADRHVAEADVYAMSRTLAGRCAEHLRKLSPFAERYGASAAPKDLGPPSGVMASVRRMGSRAVADTAPAGPMLLEDLRKLYATAQDAEITWVILLQAALAARDAELIDVVRTCQEEAQHRWQWLRTKIKESSPQVLAS